MKKTVLTTAMGMALLSACSKNEESHVSGDIIGNSPPEQRVVQCNGGVSVWQIGGGVLSANTATDRLSPIAISQRGPNLIVFEAPRAHNGSPFYLEVSLDLGTPSGFRGILTTFGERQDLDLVCQFDVNPSSLVEDSTESPDGDVDQDNTEISPPGTPR